MSNPHEKLAMEFFSPPGPSARRWKYRFDERSDWCSWIDGATGDWPGWNPECEYEIELKSQTITLPERTIPKPKRILAMTDLLGCPFCGGEARIEEIEDGGKCISCTHCMACSPVYFDRCENMIPEWNRRGSTMPGELVERVKHTLQDAENRPGRDAVSWAIGYEELLNDILAWHEGKNT